MIHRSWRASPGGSSACRPSCTRRSVLVNVPVFSGNADGRQHHVGEIRGLGEEDVLHDQAFELRQRLRAHGCTSGSDIAGFSPMMYMPRILPACTASMISTTVRPGLWVERRAPQLLELLARVGVVDALVVGIHHRDQPRVGRALHVVLAAQRMQARAGPADLAGHQRQRDQAARVVGAVDVLRDAHAPEDHRAPSTSRRGARLRGWSRRGCRRPAPSLRGCSPRRSSAAPRSRRCARR